MVIQLWNSIVVLNSPAKLIIHFGAPVKLIIGRNHQVLTSAVGHIARLWLVPLRANWTRIHRVVKLRRVHARAGDEPKNNNSYHERTRWSVFDDWSLISLISLANWRFKWKIERCSKHWVDGITSRWHQSRNESFTSLCANIEHDASADRTHAPTGSRLDRAGFALTARNSRSRRRELTHRWPCLVPVCRVSSRDMRCAWCALLGRHYYRLVHQHSTGLPFGQRGYPSSRSHMKLH